MQDDDASWDWPVVWAPAVRRAVAEGRHPDSLMERPELLVHRILDRLGVRARAVHEEVPGAREALAKAVHTLARGAPWLVDMGGSAENAAAAACASASGADTLVDERGVVRLLCVAGEVAGREGVRVVQGLHATATAAERLLPAFGSAASAGDRADVAALAGAWSGGTTTTVAPPSTDGEALAAQPAWAQLAALGQATAAAPPPSRCIRLIIELSENLPPGPEPERPVTWTTGIQRVEVIDGCTTSAKLVIHGRGFGASGANVGVVASMWDPQSWTVVHRQVSVVSWSDTQVRVALGSLAVSGSVAFLDLGFLRTWRDYAKRENERARQTLQAAGCRPQDIVLTEYGYAVTTAPAAEYQVSAPVIVAEVHRDAAGSKAPGWGAKSAHVEGGKPFWLVWRTANAHSAVLRGADAASSQVLADAGHPASGVPGIKGSVRLVAPVRASILQFRVEAANGLCGTVNAPLRIVVTGAPILPLTITALQSLPGGDVDVVTSSGVESLNPASGESIPLVAEKRTIVRIDWWPALPQIPAGERITAVASLKVTNHGAAPAMSGTLHPSPSTGDDPSAGGLVELSSGPPFGSVAEYQQWLAAGNQAPTFNVILPAGWSKWQAILEATVTGFAPGPTFTVKTTVWIKFHLRRRVRIRYRRHTSPGLTTPTTAEAVNSLRAGASLLPIPDPEIVVLGNDPAAVSTGYIEDMAAERAGTPADRWKDEIWLVVGPVGVGGFADQQRWPWTGATEATGTVTAHEIGHMFGNNHLNLCGAGGDNPAGFPHQGNVRVTGWDTWNNSPMRNRVDLMGYCWGSEWMSPERWRRIFLKVGKP